MTYVESIGIIRKEVMSIMDVDIPHPVWRVRSFPKGMFKELPMDEDFPEWINLSVPVHLSNGMVEDIFFGVAIYMDQVRVGFVIGDWINERVSHHIIEPIRSTWEPSAMRESSPGKILFDYEFTLDTRLWMGYLDKPEYMVGLGRVIGAHCKDVWMHLFNAMGNSGFVPYEGKIHDMGTETCGRVIKVHVMDISCMDSLKSAVLNDQDSFVDSIMSAEEYGDEDVNTVYISIRSIAHERIMDMLRGLEYVDKVVVESDSEESGITGKDAYDV